MTTKAEEASKSQSCPSLLACPSSPRRHHTCHSCLQYPAGPPQLLLRLSRAAPAALDRRRTKWCVPRPLPLESARVNTPAATPCTKVQATVKLHPGVNQKYRILSLSLPFTIPLFLLPVKQIISSFLSHLFCATHHNFFTSCTRICQLFFQPTPLGQATATVEWHIPTEMRSMGFVSFVRAKNERYSCKSLFHSLVLRQ